MNTQVYYTTSIGAYSRASNTSATALGYNAQATGANSIVLCGSNYSTPASATATHSIQLGYGTNSTANTFNVGLSETDNYRLLSSNGTIPADRLPNAINKYSSMPTAASTNLGWIVQYTGTTDANYTHGYIYECVSDGGNPATYSWSAVSVQAGGSSLPSQTGNSGKFLTTDGTDASWGNALANKATGTNAISVLGNASSNSNAINIGAGTTGGTSGIAIGSNAYSASQTVAIGYDSTTSNQGTAVGYNAVARDYCVAVGYQAKVAMNTYYGTAIGYTANVASGAKGAIQLGKGTNSTAGTFSVGLSTDGSTWNNYELLSANGTVPHARLTNAVVSNSISIAVADWNGGTTCSKTVSGLTATSVVWVAPDNASQSDYLTAGVYASAQTTDTITFTCTTTPTSALTVNVIYC